MARKIVKGQERILIAGQVRNRFGTFCFIFVLKITDLFQRVFPVLNIHACMASSHGHDPRAVSLLLFFFGV